jgi:hypothetical protein
VAAAKSGSDGSGLEIPVAIFDGRGLFVTQEAGNTRRIVVYARM